MDTMELFPTRRQGAIRAAQFAVIVVVTNLVIGAIFGFTSPPRTALTIFLTWIVLMLLWTIQVRKIVCAARGRRTAIPIRQPRIEITPRQEGRRRAALKPGVGRARLLVYIETGTIRG